MKTEINFVENNANATTFAKNLPRRGLERILSASGEQKGAFQWCEVRFRDFDVEALLDAAVCRIAKETGGVLLPCDGDGGSIENGVCRHGQCRENVGQSSGVSWGGT